MHKKFLRFISFLLIDKKTPNFLTVQHKKDMSDIIRAYLHRLYCGYWRTSYHDLDVRPLLCIKIEGDEKWKMIKTKTHCVVRIVAQQH